MMAGILVLLAFAVLAMVVVRPGQTATGGDVFLPRIEYRSFWLGLAFFALVFSVFRAPHAMGLVAGLLIHEMGHYGAYRMFGHGSARFRTLPMAAGNATSDSELRSDTEEAFVALAGAALSVVPMVLLVGIAMLLDPATSALHVILMPIGGTIAALNFINLLPLWPLDGGRCLTLISRSLTPKVTAKLLLATSAFAVALGFYTQSTTLLMTCLIGAHIFFYPDSFVPKHAAMPARHAILVSLTWVSLLAVHFAGGWWLLQWFYFSGL
jgi:Zn-dependent protease